MAFPQALLFLATILMATTKSSNSFLIDGTKITHIRISGRVTCDIPPQVDPPPESQPVLNGTNVVLHCGGPRKSMAQTLADVYGTYELVFNTTESVLFDSSDCAVIVRLPIALCFIYPPTGTLRATLKLVALLQPLFNAVATFTAGPLELVT